MAGSFWNKYTQQRVTRRRVLQSAGVAGAAAGAVWLVGCGGGDDDDGANGSPEPGETAQATAVKGEPDVLNEKNPPVRGGRYQESATANFDTFDPHLGIASSTAYFPRIYNVLVRQSSARPEFFYYDLAESHENPDDLTWVFKIRPGVKIAPNTLGVDERDMNAEDVVATFERIKNEPRANNGAFIKDNVKSVAATGDTFTINMVKPYAWLLDRVGNFVNTIPPRELITGAANLEAIRSKSAGGGPFVLISSTEGEGAKLDRNPNYYRKDDRLNNNQQLPYIDGIDVRLIADRSATRTAFLDGQLHDYTPETKAEADELASNYTIAKDPVFTYIALTMHPEKDPFKDPRVRRAFALAINRKQYVDLVYQGDAQPNGIVHWPTGSYAFTGKELEELQPYDPDEAKKLVEAVGGIRVKMMYPADSTIEQHDKHLPIFLEQMKAVGIEIDQDPQDFTTWLENYRTLNYTLSLSLNQVYDTPEVSLDFHHSTGPIADRSYVVGIGDSEIDAAIAKTKETLDFEERVQAVRDAQKLIWSKDPAFLPFVSPVGYTAYSKKVHNVPAGIGTSAGLINWTWLEA